MTVRDIFVPRCNVRDVTARELIRLSILDHFPNDTLPIAFAHPCNENIKIFIGGEIPHWVKKFLNRLERSNAKKTKFSLKFRSQIISLDMIKRAWLWDYEGFGSTRKTVLTEDHF